MMSLHIDSTLLPYTLQLKNLCNVSLINSEIHIFPCLCDTDTKRYNKMTFGVTNFQKQAVFSRKTIFIVFLLCNALLLSLFCNTHLKRSFKYCYNSCHS